MYYTLIKADRRAALEQICNAMGVSILYAFGSRAREIYDWLEARRPHLSPGPSDVDIGARAAAGTTWLARASANIKEIATRLKDRQVLTDDEADVLFQMAGYRNRLVHLYHELTPDELYRIYADRLGNIERVANAYRRWVNTHAELMNDRL